MAGSAGSPYSEAREVSVKLMQGLIVELEASHDVRLGRPLGASQDKARPKLAEAWRSGLSKAILLESVKSIADIYRKGGFDQASREVGKTALADRIIAGFENVIAQTDALAQPLPEAFTTAQDREKLKAIRADLKVLTGLLSTIWLLPSASAGFQQQGWRLTAMITRRALIAGLAASGADAMISAPLTAGQADDRLLIFLRSETRRPLRAGRFRAEWRDSVRTPLPGRGHATSISPDGKTADSWPVGLAASC